MPATTSFFIAGHCEDRAYANVRDSNSEVCQRAKDYTELLWKKYSKFADPNFKTDARNHFRQRFWEMYLYCALEERGFAPTRHGSEGPEFYFKHAGQKIWVEAIAPKSGSGRDAVPPRISDGEMREVPAEKILLRFTHAVQEKFKKYKKDLAKQIVAPDDFVLLCINSGEIPNASFSGELPYYVQACLPFGSLQFFVNPKTGESSEVEFQFRNTITKRSGNIVSTENFLNEKMAPLIAVLHSSVDCANRPDVLGADFSILHNPMSSYSLDHELFCWAEQFRLSGESLKRTYPCI